MASTNLTWHLKFFGYSLRDVPLSQQWWLWSRSSHSWQCVLCECWKFQLKTACTLKGGCWRYLLHCHFLSGVPGDRKSVFIFFQQLKGDQTSKICWDCPEKWVKYSSITGNPRQEMAVQWLSLRNDNVRIMFAVKSTAYTVFLQFPRPHTKVFFS